MKKFINILWIMAFVIGIYNLTVNQWMINSLHETCDERMELINRAISVAEQFRDQRDSLQIIIYTIK